MALWLGFAVALLTACGGEPVEAIPTRDSGCPGLTVIGARGSGQQVDEAEPAGFGTEAATLATAVGAAAAEAPYDWSTAYVAVDYAAIDEPTARAAPSRFDRSVRAGALDAVDRAREAVDDCPETALVVIGSSQGAVVAHGFAALVAADDDLDAVRSQVLGVVLLGDPTRDRSDGDVEQLDLGGVSAEPGFLATDVLDVGPALGGRVLSVCVAGDSVCASPDGATWRTLVVSETHHTAYTTDEVVDPVLSWLGSRPVPTS